MGLTRGTLSVVDASGALKPVGSISANGISDLPSSGGPSERQQVCDMLRKAPPIEAEFTGIDLSAFRAIEQSMIGYSWEQALTTFATFNFLAQLKETYLVSKVRAARAKHAMRRSPRKSKWLGRNLSKNAVDMKPMRKL